MARAKNPRYRDPGEHAGYRWRDTHLKCPKCGGACRVLTTPALGNARGIECTACPWSQYPGNAPPLPSTDASRTVQQKRAEAHQRCQPNSNTRNAADPPENHANQESRSPEAPE